MECFSVRVQGALEVYPCAQGDPGWPMRRLLDGTVLAPRGPAPRGYPSPSRDSRPCSGCAPPHRSPVGGGIVLGIGGLPQRRAAGGRLL